jgi:hypothetical protein
VRAALSRYVARWKSGPEAVAVATAGGGDRFEEHLETHCTDCHQDLQEPTFTRSVADPRLLLRIASQVAFHGMPKDAELALGTRYEIVDGAIRRALPNAEARRAASSYLLDQGQALPVHAMETATELVLHAARRAPAPGDDAATRPWALYENAVGLTLEDRSWTPSFTATIGLHALLACRASSGAEADACIARATDPALLSKTSAERGLIAPVAAPSSSP